MEEDALRAKGVLENGVHGSDRAAEVFLIESDGDVDKRRVTDGGVLSDGSTFSGIAERGGLPEGEPVRRGDPARESKIGIEMRGSNGFSRREGLQRRSEDDDSHEG